MSTKLCCISLVLISFNVIALQENANNCSHARMVETIDTQDHLPNSQFEHQSAQLNQLQQNENQRKILNFCYGNNDYLKEFGVGDKMNVILESCDANQYKKLQIFNTASSFMQNGGILLMFVSAFFSKVENFYEKSNALNYIFQATSDASLIASSGCLLGYKICEKIHGKKLTTSFSNFSKNQNSDYNECRGQLDQILQDSTKELSNADRIVRILSEQHNKNCEYLLKKLSETLHAFGATCLFTSAGLIVIDKCINDEKENLRISSNLLTNFASFFIAFYKASYESYTSHVVTKFAKKLYSNGNPGYSDVGIDNKMLAVLETEDKKTYSKLNFMNKISSFLNGFGIIAVFASNMINEFDNIYSRANFEKSNLKLAYGLITEIASCAISFYKAIAVKHTESLRRSFLKLMYKITK